MLSVDIKSIKIIQGNSDRNILNDICFRMEPNKINVILGKNGSGKSTLIKSLIRLLDERLYTVSGSVFFDNIDLLKVPPDKLLSIRKNKISYVFQDAINSLDPLKKTEFYFRNYIDDDKLVLLLKEFLLPGKDKLLKLHPYELSGGMAQRLLLVIALLKDPDILILDEPTSGIDTPISNLILLKLKEFVGAENKSILLVTQDLQFSRNAGDRISFISEGRLSPFYNVSGFFEEQKIAGAENFISAFNELL